MRLNSPRTPTLVLVMCAVMPLVQTSGYHKDADVRGEVSKVNPLWAVDLTPLGFQRFRRGFVNDYGSMSSIACTKDIVAIGFETLTKNAGGRGTARFVPNPQPYRLTVVFFDAKTGKRLATRSWAAAAIEPEMIYGTQSGRFVVHVHETKQGKELLGPSTLVLLSSNFEELRRVGLPLKTGSPGEWWEVEASADGRTLMLCHVQGAVDEDEIIDADTLESQATWEDSHSGAALSLVGHEILRKKGLGSDTSDLVYVRASDQAWRAVGSFEGFPKLLSEGLIVVTGGRDGHSGGVEILRTTGETLLSEDLEIQNQRALVGPAERSADGRHFAAVVNSCVRHSCYGYRRFVFVWEAPKKQPVLGVQISTDAPMFPGVGLSPDGTLLAVVSKAKLQVYGVPK